MNVTVVPAGSYIAELSEEAPLERSIVFSSWAVLAMLYDGQLTQRHFKGLEAGLRDAVSDSIEVCRAAVRVVDMHAVNVDFLLDPSISEDGRRGEASFVHRLTQLMRGKESKKERRHHRMNMTQVKASYEVRMFPQMRMPEAEVARRIDRLQLYSKFGELNRLLQRSLSGSDYPFADTVAVDDVGFASRHVTPRPAMLKSAVADCVEEGLLYDARRWHQSVVGISLVLVVLITCAGSAVFTIKHPSIVPSRMNPLMGGGQG